jgi:hypothetical protein
VAEFNEDQSCERICYESSLRRIHASGSEAGVEGMLGVPVIKSHAASERSSGSVVLGVGAREGNSTGDVGDGGGDGDGDDNDDDDANWEKADSKSNPIGGKDCGGNWY